MLRFSIAIWNLIDIIRFIVRLAHFFPFFFRPLTTRTNRKRTAGENARACVYASAMSGK